MSKGGAGKKKGGSGHASGSSRARTETGGVGQKAKVRAVAPYNQKEVLAIVYDIWISGTKLGMAKKSCINSIEIKETVDGSDSATINITDPEFLYIEDDVFLEENKIKIEIGWDNTTYRVKFNGYISAIDIDFNSEGSPKLIVTCMDNTHKMNRKKKNKTFKNTTSASVVKNIVKSYGFTCVIDSDYKFTKQETITQSNQSDIEFITKLAGDEVYPFTARLVGDTFYYVKKGKLKTPKLTLTYRKYPHEVISFNPKINKEYKQVEINSSNVNTGNKTISSTKGTVSTGSGSSSSGNKKPSSGSGYVYNPNTKTWTKK